MKSIFILGGSRLQIPAIKKAKDKGGIDGQGKEREQTVQQKKCFVYNDTHNILPKACLISECFLYRSISVAGKQCDICHCRC